MASAHPYSWQTASGVVRRRWRAQWTDELGKRQGKRGFERKADAERYARDRETEVRHGVQLAGLGEGATLAAWSSTWLAGLDVRDSTLEVYRYALARILPRLGERELTSLRPSELRAWRRSLSTRLAPATVDGTARVLAMLLRAAVQDGLIDASPMPAVGRREVRVLEPDELLSLEQVRLWGEAMPLVGRELPVVAAATGLRQAELLGLQVPAVDWLRRTVRVLPDVGQLVTPSGAGTPTYGPPKTRAAVRTVPLPAVALAALSRHLERFPPVEGEPIFRTTTGQRWRRGHFRETWSPAARAAGLPGWVHWHALRDVAASVLIRQGNDVRVVMSILGHTSAEETLRTYAKLFPDSVDRARQSVDAMWQDDDAERGQGTV